MKPSRPIFWGILFLFLFTPSSWALDHDNLDRNRPLRIEDAYPIAKGEIGVESGIRIDDLQRGASLFTFSPQVIYGAFYNTQIELGGRLTAKRGNEPTEQMNAGVLYNFNAETLRVPALAVKLGMDFLNEGRPGAVDVTVGGLLTRTIGRWRTHLNGEVTRVGKARTEERRGLYQLAAGLNYPLGYPMRFRETVIADIFTRRSARVGDQNATGMELGIRHQLSSRVVLDAGVGTEFAGPSDRSALFGTVGFSVGF